MDRQGLAGQLEKRFGVTLELPVRELVERGAEPLGGDLDDSLSLDICFGAAAQLRVRSVLEDADGTLRDTPLDA